MPNIAIVWDFDGTLTPLESTGKVAEILDPTRSAKAFWDQIKSLRGDKSQQHLAPHGLTLPRYIYSSAEIDYYGERFTELWAHAARLAEQISEHIQKRGL